VPAVVRHHIRQRRDHIGLGLGPGRTGSRSQARLSLPEWRDYRGQHLDSAVTEPLSKNGVFDVPRPVGLNLGEYALGYLDEVRAAEAGTVVSG
jgi:hypothetical protein